MLPWVCDVSKNREESGKKMPQSFNIAKNFISDVTYTTKKIDDGKTATVSFLKFKLFIPRK